MNRIVGKRKAAVFLSVFFLVLLAVAHSAAAATGSDEIDRKFRALVEASSRQGVVSKDEVVRPDYTALNEGAAIASGDWTALAQKYPNPWLPGEMTNGPSPEVLAQWWNAMGDETLTRLIEKALRDNRDLRIARSKVVQARAQLGISKAAMLPWLDNTDTWSRGKTPVAGGGSGKTTELYQLEVDASWEIDIFGGLRQSVRADTASLEAQYAALHDTWVSLSSEIAIDYISLRTYQERLRIAQSNLDLQMETLDMLQSRYRSGLADTLAVNQAKYTMQQTWALIPPLQSSIEQMLNTLSILVGEVPGSLEQELGDWKPLPKPVSSDLVGIPANSIRQRPDIREAERMLVAQIARKKSAQADLWPKFYLFGSIGLESGSSGSLFSSGAQAWSFGPQITLPIFHAGAIRKNIQVQTALQEQALASYEQTVLNAVSDVRNALAANSLELQRNETLRQGVQAAQDALAAANDQYRNGLSDFSNVINAQAALLSLQEQLAVSQGEMVSDVIRIFKAMGGGWAPLTAEYTAPPPAEKASQAKR